MPTVTRAQIRQALALQVPNAYVATIGSASTTEINDTDDEQLLYQASGAKDFTGYYIVCPTAALSTDRIRRVSFHDPDLGVIKPSRAWAQAPSGTYELWPPDMPPFLIETAINDAISRLPYIRETTISTTNLDNSYSLAAYTWITNERQVKEVYWEYTNAGIVDREEYPWWKVFNNAGTLTLKLDPPPSSATGNTVVMESKDYYTELNSDSDTTACPLDWVKAAAAVELYKQLRKRNAGQDVSRWVLEMGEARKDLYEQSKRYIPRRGRRVIPRSPTRATTGLRVRRGEFYY